MTNTIACYSHLRQQKAEYQAKIIRPLEESRKRLYNENPRDEERIAKIETSLADHYRWYGIIGKNISGYEKYLTETADWL